MKSESQLSFSCCQKSLNTTPLCLCIATAFAHFLLETPLRYFANMINQHAIFFHRVEKVMVTRHRETMQAETRAQCVSDLFCVIVAINLGARLRRVTNVVHSAQKNGARKNRNAVYSDSDFNYISAFRHSPGLNRFQRRLHCLCSHFCFQCRLNPYIHQCFLCRPGSIHR